MVDRRRRLDVIGIDSGFLSNIALFAFIDSPHVTGEAVGAHVRDASDLVIYITLFVPSLVIAKDEPKTDL